uniref:Uncharacterized protein n=1 Tax=Chenopodium quinoa TaxID=63459 RepID=A0A803LEW4_CHEQI
MLAVAGITLTTKSQFLEIANDRLILLPNGLVQQPVSETLPRRPTGMLKTDGRRLRASVLTPPAPKRGPGYTQQAPPAPSSIYREPPDEDPTLKPQPEE